ncbi:sulfate/molybdate ABC transporter ATP-binding protein [Rhodococcus sp. NPDC003318]|uniref:sulfate/molybdate ABC transporter ATP-binding protein n=1 Tax=Rhodococcus sp. NPDC003318 TaxID=3364503 RepID=UPI0036A9F958
MSALTVRAGLGHRGARFDVALGDGEVLAVLGPNGAGKSTLLGMIAGLLRPDDGTVTLGDRTLVDTAAGVFVPPHDRGVALLSQQALLFPHLTAAANVAFAPRSRGMSRAQSREIAAHWLRQVDAEDLAARRPSQLSGGQAQRIAIARALAAEPRLLLLDEPMAALDVAVAPTLRRLLRRVLREQARTAVIVTHDLLDALALADRVIVVEAGVVVESGTVREVLTHPRSAFAARIAGVNLLAGTATSPDGLETPWGAAVSGIGSGAEAGSPAVALFRPAAVSVHADRPHASPRNVFAVTVSELEAHGAAVRVRAEDNPDGSVGPAADVTPAAAAELDLAPGHRVWFAVKAQEVTVHPARAARNQ